MRRARRALPAAPAPAISLPPGSRARIAARSVSRAGAVADLHRSSAAQSSDLAHDPQLRFSATPPKSSSSSPAIPRRSSTAARCCESGFVVATARILRRVWQIYVAHVFLFTIFLAEISYVATSFENPLYTEEMGIMDFLKQPDVTIVQALLLRFRPVNMDVLPLYIVLMLFLPLILWLMKWRADVTLALSVAALCRHLAIRSVSVGLSERRLGLQSVRLAIAVRVRRLVRAWAARRRMSRILSSPVTLWISFAYLFAAFCVTLTWYVPQLEPSDAALARAVDVSDRQDRSRRAAVRAFPGAGGRHRALPAEGLAGAEIALAAAADPVRAAFAGDFLPRRVPGLRRAFHAGRGLRRRRHALRYQYFRNPHHVRRGVAVFVVQARPPTRVHREQKAPSATPIWREGAS